MARERETCRGRDRGHAFQLRSPQSRVPLPQPSRTSCSRCVSLEDSMGGKWSRKACCLSCLREGTNLQGDGHVHTMPPGRGHQDVCLSPAGRGSQVGLGVHPPRGPLLSVEAPPPRPSLCKALLPPTHWSLQMQMTGLISSPPSARRRRPALVGTIGPPDSACCGPLRSRMLKRTLMAA